MLVYPRVDEIGIPPGCSGPRWRLARSQAEVVYGSTCPSSGPFSVSDARAVMATAPGTAAVATGIGVPRAQRHHARYGLISRAAAMPDGPADGMRTGHPVGVRSLARLACALAERSAR
jgi:hypothetical protein